FVVISHADAALTKTSLPPSFISRLAARERREEPANHQRSAWVSRRSRTGLFPRLELVLRQRLKKRFVDFDYTTQRTETTLGLGRHRHELGNRHLAARDDDSLAALDAREQLRQLGLGHMNGDCVF